MVLSEDIKWTLEKERNLLINLSMRKGIQESIDKSGGLPFLIKQLEDKYARLEQEKKEKLEAQQAKEATTPRAISTKAKKKSTKLTRTKK